MRFDEVRRAVFARHSHPVSAWSRLLTTPLVVLPFWVRRRWSAIAIAAWFAVNPVMTPPPRRHDAFATRAMLGEQMWSADRSLDPLMGPVNAVGSVALVAAAVGAWRHRPGLTVCGLGVNVATTWWSWVRYAAVYVHSAQPDEKPQRDARTCTRSCGPTQGRAHYPYGGWSG